AVWGYCEIRRSKPFVVRFEQVAAMGRGEGGAPAIHFVPLNAMAEQVAANVAALETRRQVGALVDDAAVGDVAAGEVGVRGMVEIAERVRIVECPMLAKTFPIISPLHAMQVAVRAEVRAVNQ